MKKSVFPLAVISLLFPLLVEAQSVYIPVIHVADELDLGVALSNPTLESVTVLLTARSYSGEQIAKDGVTNPAQVKLPAGGQRALRAAEIFGAGMDGQAGWIEVASSPAVKASFAIFDAAMHAVDGAAAMRPSGRLIFPKVSGSTQIALANVGSRPLSGAGISLYANDGAIVARNVFQLSPFSGLAGTLTDLMPEASAFEGYAVVSSAGTPFSQTSETLIGTEIYRNRSDIAVLNALNDTSYTKAGYAPHLIGQNIYDTRVILINPAAEAQVVRLTADGLKVDGQPLRPPSASAERTIPGLGRLDESLDRLLDFSGEALLTGYVRYEIQGNTPGLIGYAEYLTTNGGMLSAVPLQSVGFSDLYFSHVVEGDGFYTGLALLNPGTRPALATVDLFDREGTMIGSTTLSLEAGGQTAQLLKDLFSKAGVQRGGSIHVTATRPIIAFQFFGSSTSPDFWASVPAEGIQLPAQPAGRPV